MQQTYSLVSEPHMLNLFFSLQMCCLQTEGKMGETCMGMRLATADRSLIPRPLHAVVIKSWVETRLHCTPAQQTLDNSK